MSPLPLSARLAARNLWRNPRRTVLAVLGIGIGVALALLFDSLLRGRDAMVLKGAAENGIGHVLVAPSGWRESRDERLRLAGGEELLESLKRVPGLKALAPRIKVQALLSMGSRQLGLELAGVDPVEEPKVSRAVRRLAAGRYLQPGERGVMVLGREAAARLSVDLDDDVMATAVGPGGSLQSAMFRVVGLSDSGSEEVDATVAQVARMDAAELSGSPGLGEVALLTDGPDAIPGVLAKVRALLKEGDQALPWNEVAAELKSHVDMDAGIYSLFKGVVMFLVFLGVAGAQLTSTLERRREFAMLAALGVRPSHLSWMIVQESLALALCGALAGLCLASLPLAWLAGVGIDLVKVTGREFVTQGMLIDRHFKGGVGPWLAWDAVFLAYAATVAASTIRPGWSSRPRPPKP